MQHPERRGAGAAEARRGIARASSQLARALLSLHRPAGPDDVKPLRKALLSARVSSVASSCFQAAGWSSPRHASTHAHSSLCFPPRRTHLTYSASPTPQAQTAALQGQLPKQRSGKAVTQTAKERRWIRSL